MKPSALIDQIKLSKVPSMFMYVLFNLHVWSRFLWYGERTRSSHDSANMATVMLKCHLSFCLLYVMKNYILVINSVVLTKI